MSLPGGGRRFALLQVAREDETEVACALRILEVADAERLEAGRRELRLRSGTLRAAAGLLPVLSDLHAVSEPAVLPPTYLCKEMGVWIPVVCPGCEGPSPGRGGELCPACGSPGEGGETGDERPLDRLARRVREGAGESSLPLPCTECERRATCYPDSGPHGSGAAASVLTAISESPWIGMLCERFDLSFPQWASRVGTEIGGAVSAGEAVAVRAAAFEDLADTLGRRASGMTPPHLGIDAGAVVFRLGDTGSPARALRRSRAWLVDVAPAVRTEGGEEDSWSPPPWGGGPWSPPGGSGGGEWLEGLCISCQTTSQGSSGDWVEVSFLPKAKLERAPEGGEPFEVRIRDASDPAASLTFPGTVKVGFREVCRILVDPGEVGADRVRSMLAGEHGGAVVEVRRPASAGVFHDRFALGTLWLASLTRCPDEPETAGRLREALTGKVRELPLDGPESERLEALERVARSSDMFDDACFSQGEGGVVARGLDLGLRLCGVLALPGAGEESPEGDDDDPVAVWDAVAEAFGGLRASVLSAPAPSPEAPGPSRAEIESLRAKARDLEKQAGLVREERDRLRDELRDAKRARPSTPAASAPGGDALEVFRRLLLDQPAVKAVDVTEHGLPAEAQSLFDLVRQLSQFARDIELAVIFVLEQLAGTDMGTRWHFEKRQEIFDRYKQCLEDRDGALGALRDSLKSNHKFLVDLNQAYLDALPWALARVLEKIDPQTALERHKQMFGFDYKAVFQEFVRLHGDLANQSRDALWEMFLQPEMKRRMKTHLPDL